MPVAFFIPLLVPSTLNLREHWAVRASRSKRHRMATFDCLLEARVSKRLRDPVVVRLERRSPRMLDEGDNLPASMKAVRDAIASWFGVNDRNPIISWEYGQTSSKVSGVAVTIRQDAKR